MCSVIPPLIKCFRLIQTLMNPEASQGNIISYSVYDVLFVITWSEYHEFREAHGITLYCKNLWSSQLQKELN
jgi:hypothetical protein